MKNLTKALSAKGLACERTMGFRFLVEIKVQDGTSLTFVGSGWSVSHMNKIGVLEGLREKTRTRVAEGAWGRG